jgi:hypothetical protein
MNSRNVSRRTRLFLLSICVLSSSIATSISQDKKADKDPPLVKDKDGWISLFDGKTLKGWKMTEFGGQGDWSVNEAGDFAKSCILK